MNPSRTPTLEAALQHIQAGRLAEAIAALLPAESKPEIEGWRIVREAPGSTP